MNSKYPCHKYPLKWEDFFENSTIQACQTMPPKTFNFPFTCPKCKMFYAKMFLEIYLGWQYNYKVCVLSACIYGFFLNVDLKNWMLNQSVGP